jgi:hypothetical protein
MDGNKCEVEGCKNKGVRYIGSIFVCDRHYYQIKFPPKKVPSWAEGLKITKK